MLDFVGGFFLYILFYSLFVFVIIFMKLCNVKNNYIFFLLINVSLIVFCNVNYKYFYYFVMISKEILKDKYNI